MMKKSSFSSAYIMLLTAIFVSSFVNVFSKIAAQYDFLSIPFLFFLWNCDADYRWLFSCMAIDAGKNIINFCLYGARPSVCLHLSLVGFDFQRISQWNTDFRWDCYFDGSSGKPIWKSIVGSLRF